MISAAKSGGAMAALLVAGLALAPNLPASPASAESARVIPAPSVDEPASGARTEVAVVAGGCFWGVQGVFQHVAGVTSAVSGYDGGKQATAHYDMTSRGDTGHAESVRITFDPARISYGRILQVFFSVAHDPTQLNRQGPDDGSQYRSAVFPQTQEQARIATAYIEQLNKVHAYDGPVVTTVEGGQTFYPAEAYHQDFLARHPDHPYIAYNDLPKIEQLKRVFPELYRSEPTLVRPPS